MPAYLVTARVNPEKKDDLEAWVKGEDDENPEAHRVQRALRKGHESHGKWYLTLDGSERGIRDLLAVVLEDDLKIERLARIKETWSTQHDGDDDEE